MIIRRPRPKRFPRPKRYPKPIVKDGSIFEFEGGFPYKYVGYLNRVKAPYSLSYYPGGIRIKIKGKPKTPDADIVRKPKNQIHGLSFDIVADIAAKHKEKNPELFNRLKALQEKFLRLGRKTYIYCPQEPARHCVSLATCFARCGHKCGELSVEHLMGENDDKAEFFRDLLTFQRLVNLIYGTVREEDHFNNED